MEQGGLCAGVGAVGDRTLTPPLFLSPHQLQTITDLGTSIAAGLFAERGLRATTVRDIADAAGILSGSLYHHFSSKEAIVDEILRGFLDSLFGDYQRIVDAGSSRRETLEGLVRVSFEAIHRHRDEVAIYQDELKHLRGNSRFD